MGLQQQRAVLGTVGEVSWIASLAGTTDLHFQFSGRVYLGIPDSDGGDCTPLYQRYCGILSPEVFTYFLLKGLQSAADSNHDGTVTTGELFNYVQSEVRKATANAQHPQKIEGARNRGERSGRVKWMSTI